MKLYDMVTLIEDLPEEGLHAGQAGVVVEVYEDAYEVEFNDTDGGLIALLALKPEQLRPKQD